MQNIEHHLGRTREIHWGPRTIDLDILLYNHENIETESLIVPHPRMFERAFVLIPLLEVYDELSYKISPSQLEEMRKQEGVVVWKKKNEEDVLGLFES
jgi:2-amino-4-hydroxy-6-hydroxymethyldihydropteridine diphosphokinase